MREYREFLKLPVGFLLVLSAAWALAYATPNNVLPFQLLVSFGGVLGVSIIGSFFKVRSNGLELLKALLKLYKHLK